jgi:hypothetical protein
MAGIEDILANLPIGDIAAKLGVDPATATQAIKEGGATILGGLHRNAESEDGAAAIQQALKKHDTDIDASNVDEADGQKILGHIFGSDKQVVEQKLTEDKATAGIDFGKLLPILAPIIMNLLAKQSSGSAPATAGAESSGGGIGDIIGGLLGGLTGGGSSSSSAGGIDLGGLLSGLGGLFGGKK